MRKIRIILAVISILLLLQIILVSPALAITNPTRDTENRFPNVGIWVFPDGTFFCSGTLIAPTVMLTAAHCLDGFIGTENPIIVTFDNELIEGGEGNHWIVAENFFVHPMFGHDQANFYDLAVIFLPEGSTANLTPATLTPAGLLDELSIHGNLRGAEFTSVGYGFSGFSKDPENGLHQYIWDGWRNYASAPLMALTPTQIYLNINWNATGGGGACTGDSGGPILLPIDGKNILVGVTTLRSDQLCKAMTTYYRIDTPWAREFLGQFVPLP
jgi:hypothetical protein